jgi:hypothetical protein
MQHSIKFNHDGKRIGDTFNVNPDELSTKLTEIIRDYMENDEYTKRSHIAELLADRLTLEEILFLALTEVENTISKFDEKMQKINEALEKIIGDDKD